jgi:zinc protease
MPRPTARLLTLVAALAFLPVLAQPQPGAARPAKAPASTSATNPPPAAMDIPIPQIPFTKFVLGNGLTVLVHEDHKTPVVAINTWYHVGSKNEKPGKTGFAHLFEHLMFSGSENFNEVFLNAMERIGATSLNGTTNTDRTNYFENVPTSMLDYALFAESDRMAALLPVLDQKKLDLQRGVVQNEKRQRENQPYGVTEQLQVENSWPKGHPYSWTVIGSMTDLDAASMGDVTDWFKTNYGPNNTVLVIAGDITPEVARQKVEKYFGGIPPGPPLSRQGTWIAKRTGSHRVEAQDRVPQSRMFRSWNVPQFGSREDPLLDLAAQVLGGGKASRLYERLVYRDQIATSVGAENDSMEIAGVFEIDATAKPGIELARVERAADEELRRFLKEGPTPQELQLAKTRILSSYVRVVERIGGFGGKSDLLARCQTFVGNPDCYKQYLQRVKDATPAAVRQAAGAWLADGDLVVAVSPYPSTLKPGASLDRSKPPALGQAEKLVLPPMQRATLSNGLNVVLAERHDAPVVNLSLMVDSGYAADSPQAPGVASLSLRAMEEGTKTRDALKLARDLEAIGATFNTQASLDWATVNFNVLKATLPQALPIFADLVLNPGFREADFQRLQRDRLAGIQREKVTPQLMALRVVPPLLYPAGHPYAVPLTGSGTEASVSRMTVADVAKFHATWFRPNNATLLVVGDTTMAEIKPRLEALLAGWKSAEVPKKVLSRPPQPTGSTVYLVDRPGALQSIVVGAQIVPPRGGPNDVATLVLNDAFAGSFSSRVNMNLREDKHWAYGSFSLFENARGDRPYLVVAPVQTDKTADSIKELANEYARIAGAQPLSAVELQDAQERQTLKLPGNFETSAQVAGAYRNIVGYGLPADYYETFAQNALATTPQSIEALARQFVDPKRITWVVVGDLSKIEPGIRALNLGEVKKIDVDGKPVN